MSSRAAARTWPSSRSCDSAGARTNGDGTVSAAIVMCPSVTAAEAAQTPRSISSSLTAHSRPAGKTRLLAPRPAGSCWPGSKAAQMMR
ncbi:MAG TPA: hypothetical protein VGG75_36920 [Trebonia sp.]